MSTLIDELVSDPDIFKAIRCDAQENGIGLEIHNELLTECGDLINDRVCILKLDELDIYNSRATHNPPKSIDYLVVVQCCDGSTHLYLIELRKANGNRPTRRLGVAEIGAKFDTAVYDFLEEKYAHIFGKHSISKVFAYLVTDPWRCRRKPNGQDVFDKKVKLSALDAYSSMKPYKILGKIVQVQPVLPPNPIVVPC